MKNNYKNIAIAIILVVLGTAIGYMYSEKRNKLPTPSTDCQKNVPTNKSVNNNIDISNITPFSSDIVIYNSHAGENYPSGLKVTDVGVLINNKLVKEGLKSRFIKCNPPTEYAKAYKITHDLITKNVKNYSDTILLDIHRDTTENPKSDTKKIQLILAKGNPHYKENKKFADLLLAELRKSTEVKSDIFEFNGEVLSYFNQDLSNNSMLIEIGNDMSSDSDIEECINVLVSALKNNI
ncbi:stage II sporulation protein P [Clostridium ganghwense]|uniref:Stage II sporulation protein P n=1 Tax=Clostridium ganghwense TaxID=312089 RepID=A0ABT4CVS8_9CLOT|nr:stage II sporulation protein P [Clostridium ganghwense]MCY6372151.1 stage II sporulation protein P [Clostridium ganghwense]